MRINFVIGNKDETDIKFTDKQRELVIYITNPFKLGLGFKYRYVDTKNIHFGDYINPETGLKDGEQPYYKVGTVVYRWTLLHLLYDYTAIFGTKYVVDTKISTNKINKN